MFRPPPIVSASHVWAYGYGFIAGVLRHRVVVNFPYTARSILLSKFRQNLLLVPILCLFIGYNNDISHIFCTRHNDYELLLLFAVVWLSDCCTFAIRTIARDYDNITLSMGGAKLMCIESAMYLTSFISPHLCFTYNLTII